MSAGGRIGQYNDELDVANSKIMRDKNLCFQFTFRIISGTDNIHYGEAFTSDHFNLESYLAKMHSDQLSIEINSTGRISNSIELWFHIVT